MATSYIESQGTRLMRGDAASPEVFTLVPQIISLSGPDGTANEIDITTLDSTGKEFVMGLKDEGQITCEMIWNDNLAQHAGLESDRSNRTQRNFQIRYSDSPNTVLSFAAFVLGLSRTHGVDDVNRSSMTLRVTGAITVS